MQSSFSCDEVNVWSVTRVFLMTSEGITSCEVRIDRIGIRVTRKYFGCFPAHITTQLTIELPHPVGSLG